MSYVQVGWMLTAPNLIGNVVEPDLAVAVWSATGLVGNLLLKGRTYHEP